MPPLVTKLMLETIGGRVEDFAIEPNEKLTLEADDRALFLVSKEKRIPIAPLGDYSRYFMQKDKIDEMVHAVPIQCNVQLDRN